MRAFLTFLFSFILVFAGYGQQRSTVMFNRTNGVLLSPTNFWTANSNGINAIVSGASGFPLTSDANLGGYTLTNGSLSDVDISAADDGSGYNPLFGGKVLIDVDRQFASQPSDYLKIQRALDYVTNSSKGGIVLLSARSYSVTNTLQVKTNGTALMGAGPYQTVISYTPTTSCAISNYIWDYCTFEKFRLTAVTWANNTNSIGIWICPTNNAYNYAPGRQQFKDLVIDHFYTGVYNKWCVGSTFENVEAYGNVIGFDVDKSDANVWVNCFAGNNADAANFGSYTNIGKGWWFHSTYGAGWPPFGNTIVGGEMGRSVTALQVDAGHVTVIGLNAENGFGNQVKLFGGYLNLINCRLWQSTNYAAARGTLLPGDAVYVTNLMASHLTLQNCEIDTNLNSGYSQVRIFQADQDLPRVVGTSLTISNDYDNATHELTGGLPSLDYYSEAAAYSEFATNVSIATGASVGTPNYPDQYFGKAYSTYGTPTFAGRTPYNTTGFLIDPAPYAVTVVSGNAILRAMSTEVRLYQDLTFVSSGAAGGPLIHSYGDSTSGIYLPSTDSSTRISAAGNQVLGVQTNGVLLPATSFGALPTGTDVRLWNSNGTLYVITATTTNDISTPP